MKKWQPQIRRDDNPDIPTPVQDEHLGEGEKRIDHPPCWACRHWKPQLTYRHTPEGFVKDGVRLCHAAEMFSDFSCFKAPDKTVQ